MTQRKDDGKELVEERKGGDMCVGGMNKVGRRKRKRGTK